MTPDDDSRRPPGRSDDELLRRVHQRAAKLRSRRRGSALAVTSVMLAVMGVTGLTQLRQDNDRLVRTASGPPTSGSQVLATTTTSSSPEPTPTTAAGPSPTIDTGAPVTTAPAPSTTVNPCRNSRDPACGPFSFEPPPDPDQPMTVEVIPSTATVKVGEPMSFHTIRRDPDGVSAGGMSYDLGDKTLMGEPAYAPCYHFGPWDPPPKGLTPTVLTEDIPHTYTLAGTFTVTFVYFPGTLGGCVDQATGRRAEDPYGSQGQGSVQVIVLP